jgi:hypothetical protein
MAGGTPLSDLVLIMLPRLIRNPPGTGKGLPARGQGICHVAQRSALNNSISAAAGARLRRQTS